VQSGQPGSGARGGWSARSPEGPVSRPDGSLGGVIGQQHDALPGGDPGLMTSVVRCSRPSRIVGVAEPEVPY
jgi:hypothetical protein